MSEPIISIFELQVSDMQMVQLVRACQRFCMDDREIEAGFTAAVCCFVNPIFASRFSRLRIKVSDYCFEHNDLTDAVILKLYDEIMDEE